MAGTSGDKEEERENRLLQGQHASSVGGKMTAIDPWDLSCDEGSLRLIPHRLLPWMAENLIVSDPQILCGEPCARGTRLAGRSTSEYDAECRIRSR